MLDMKFIRENIDAVEAALKTRSDELSLGDFKNLDSERRRLLSQVEALKAQKNSASEEIARTKDKSQVADTIAGTLFADTIPQGALLSLKQLKEYIK